jgi:dihydrofolate reductase
MRSVVLSAGMSLDGYIARTNGAVDFLVMPEDYSMASFFTTIDTAIMGRKTFDASLALDRKQALTMASQMETYVFSRSEPAGKRNGVTYVSESPATLVGRLRQRPGKNIFLMGGGELARSFLQADLVDELLLGIVPVLLGEGIPLFPSSFTQRDFTLVENRAFLEGLTVLTYSRTRPASA